MPGRSPLPHALDPVEGPLPTSLCEGAVGGLGGSAGPLRELVDAGLVPPDVLTGMTLYLLANQPRRSRPDEERRGAIEGAVWIREQVTYHAPVPIGSKVCISGASARRYVRRGRRYGVTTSETRSESGALLVSSCTTGLLSYRRDPDLTDRQEGLKESELPVVGPDEVAATRNPCLEALRRVRTADQVGAGPALVTLEMMRLRDAGRDDNPIHTDPAVARREGLVAPIAGGSHVLSFLQTALMKAWGAECLLHGAHFDVRWVGQTRAETHVTPLATVTHAAPTRIEAELEIVGEDRPVLQGTMVVPLGAPSS